PRKDDEFVLAMRRQAFRPGIHLRTLPATQCLRRRRTDSPSDVIQPTVVMPLKPQELRLARLGSRHTKRRLDSLRSIQTETHQFSRRNQLVQLLSKFDFFQMLPRK